MPGKSSSIFWIGMLTALSVGVGVLLTAGTKPLRAENDAEATICRDMADEVLDGEASRFDYMATRCPADLLVPAGDA